MLNNIIKTYPELNNVSLDILNENTQNLESRKIYQIEISRKGYCKRIGNEVDRFKIESVLKKFDNHKSISFFTPLDYKSDNTINIPLGFIRCGAIKKTPQYYKEYNQNIKHYGNLFWRGDITTHEIRNQILNYFENKINFDVANWRPANGRFYMDNACTEYEYDTYFDRLKQADTFLIMRGDKPWTNSFFDCLRANTIPICIDTFYHKLGWHKIGFKTDDLFLNFDLKEDDLEKVENEIQSLLKDKDRVLYMKENLLRFYEQVVLQDKYLSKYGASVLCAGWGNTIKSKLLQIHNNDYKLTDNCLFT